MRIFVFLILSLLTVGCATLVLPVDVPNIEKSASLNVIDLRPEAEKSEKNKIFSLSIVSNAYGIYRIGTKVIEPNALRIFQHRVYEKFSHAVLVPEVKVHHLVVYSNLKSELRRGVTGGLLAGVVGAAVASSTQKYGVDGHASIVNKEEFDAAEKEYLHALYTEEENPDKASVLFVYLDAEIDGKRTFIRTLTPLRFEADDKRIPYVVGVEAAIAYFLDQPA